MEKLFLVIAAALLFTPIVAAQTGFQGDYKELKVGENETVNVTVENRLPIDDVLNVKFEGDAITSGLVGIDMPEGFDCEESQRRCNLSVDAESRDYLLLGLTGTAIGQETLVAEVNSTTTQLSSEDRIEVRVQPDFAPVTVSAPGIELFQLLLLGMAGALVFQGREWI